LRIPDSWRKVDTAFLDEHMADVLTPPKADVPDAAFIAAALATELGVGRAAPAKRAASNDEGDRSPWGHVGPWQIGRGK
jgi:hypothetical protein